MKKIVQYKCEICGLTYFTEIEAINCEAKHGTPREIIKQNYKYTDMIYGYPRFINIKMSNGKLCEYAYSKEVED